MILASPNRLPCDVNLIDYIEIPQFGRKIASLDGVAAWLPSSEAEQSGTHKLAKFVLDRQVNCQKDTELGKMKSRLQQVQEEDQYEVRTVTID